MTRIALAPCSPFTVTEELMVRSAELAERLDVRLHTHFAENAEDDEFSLATFGCRPTEYLERTGWCTDRTWVAHCVMPDADEIRRLGAAGVGVAHCPSSNLILASGIAPVVDLRAAGVHVGLGVDGSSSADSASLWLEARQAMLLAKLRDGAAAGTARMALEMATLGGAGVPRPRRASSACSRRAPSATSPCGRSTGPAFAGAIADPIEAWLRCGPVGARHTIVHGRPVVRDGALGQRPSRRDAGAPTSACRAASSVCDACSRRSTAVTSCGGRASRQNDPVNRIRASSAAAVLAARRRSRRGHAPNRARRRPARTPAADDRASAVTSATSRPSRRTSWPRTPTTSIRS